MAHAQRILIADDLDDALFVLERALVHHGYEVEAVRNGVDALAAARRQPPDAAIVDLVMPGLSGAELAAEFKADPQLCLVPIILLTAREASEELVTALECGADDFLTKPFQAEELIARLRSALRARGLYEELRQSEARNRFLSSGASHASATRGVAKDFSGLVGCSDVMREVFSLVERIAAGDASVLITGPTGTGKELVARAIHDRSERAGRPFIAKNCAAFQESLLESELFGHVRGAFTGAIGEGVGLFEAASGGSLFLDEIGEMSPNLQAKLLRVLQDGVVEPVGGISSRRVDVRVLAATHRDLPQLIAQGQFREDLYYRLNVISVDLPPLSERRDDIPLLVEHFLMQLQPAVERRKALSSDAIELLTRYSWRGNVRELRNEIERVLIVGSDQEDLSADLLSERIRGEVPVGGESAGSATAGGATGLKQAVSSLERQLIHEAMNRHGGNKSIVARELGISRSSLISKVKQFGL